VPASSRLDLLLGGEGEPYRLNDGSFSQMCKLAGVSKDTLPPMSVGPNPASRAVNPNPTDPDRTHIRRRGDHLHQWRRHLFLLYNHGACGWIYYHRSRRRW
jgi:hypothetical protein